MATQADAASSRGVDLLVFPVATLCGPMPLDFGMQTAFMRDAEDVLGRLASVVPCDCLVPVVKVLDEFPVVEVVLLRGGAATPLRFGPLSGPSLREDTTDETMRTALALPVVEAKGGNVQLAFSYEDLDDLCEYGTDADAVCLLSDYGFAVDDVSSALGAALAEARFSDDATDLGAWLVCVGSVGGYGTQVFAGSSCVISPAGQLVAVSPAFEEDLLVADLQAATGPDAQDCLEPELYDGRAHLWQALVLGIRDFVRDVGKSDAVLALDGSIASMLLAVLATDALGPTHVHAVLAAAEAHPRARMLEGLVSSLRIASSKAYPDASGDEAASSDAAMVQLAARARELGAVVLSSHDKTALALELREDRLSLGSFAPLGDVYRSDVLDVARLRNTVSPVMPPLEVLDCDLPSLGLAQRWGRERLLQQVDVVLASHVEGGWGLSEIAMSMGDDELVSAVLSCLRNHDLARASMPPCLALTTRTLDEYRMPLGLAWHDHRREVTPLVGTQREETHSREASPKSRRTSRQPSAGDDVMDEYAVREALGLLHDLASERTPEWHPFSEN